jgi:two-component system chemotaxis response regulator CheY
MDIIPDSAAENLSGAVHPIRVGGAAFAQKGILIMKISEMTVLICDDSPLIRKKMSEILKKIGVAETIFAEDGEMAVEMYRSHRPDLVFMDIVMPKKTGIDAIREIKEADPDAKVVMASTVGTQKNLISAIKAGAFEFLQKPVKEEDVIKIINLMIKG